jgi:uncharacterized protein YjbI with pentapeptide repeats
MANEEQLSILRQGVDVWNRWRENNSQIEIDLSRASLSHIDLMYVDLNGANLSMANMRGARLTGAILADANLSGANLGNTELESAVLVFSDLREAILHKARLFAALLMGADLRDADLREADLTGADFNQVKLDKTNFSSAVIGSTTFGSLDLRGAIGLETIDHRSPSTIGIDTITRSGGKIPRDFLRGCGLSDWDIEGVKLYNQELSTKEIDQVLRNIYSLRTSEALPQSPQLSPLFISYSHANSEFVDRIGSCLTEKGIRYWRDIHDMKAGRMEKQVDRAIRQNPTVLLVLSKNSLGSDWVEHEVRTARLLEKDLDRDVLCPVALDDSWKDSPWPKKVMEQIMEYNILDFSEWRDDRKFDAMFRRLIDGLELFYKG